MSFWNKDAFGNDYTVVKLKPNKNNYPVGYVEIGNKLYKIETSDSKKDGVLEWCKITALPKRAQRRGF